MIIPSLIITFCSLTECQEYVVDKAPLNCEASLMIERNKLVNMDSQVAYRDYMTQFKAEGMFDADDGVSWQLSCLSDN